MKKRVEHDPLGKKAVPADAYYGIHTFRAFENFQISRQKVNPRFIISLLLVKIAAARANQKLGFLEKHKADAIVKAAREALTGKFDDHFVLDPFQAGGGTPTHMNVNEVLANRANELLGGKKGHYNFVHPNDHVNMGQSSNNVMPSAAKIAALFQLQDLLARLKLLERALLKKSAEFRNIIKSGRTHLQDAVPITLGQEFHAYATSIKKQRIRLEQSQAFLRQLGVGGNAVGTGLNTHPNFRRLIIKELRTLTTLRLDVTPDGIESTQSMADLAALSATLALLALELNRIANDLRLLSSGPRTGLNEIRLPAIEPGSSIMPGKVNPSIAECLTMVCLHVIGNNLAVQLAAGSGQLELNVLLPLVAHDLLQSEEYLTNGIEMFVRRCLLGIKANKDVCKQYAERSMGLATALNPYLGYEKAAEVVREALRTQATIPEVLRRRKDLPPHVVKELLNLKNLTRPNLRKKT